MPGTSRPDIKGVVTKPGNVTASEMRLGCCEILMFEHKKQREYLHSSAKRP